MKNLTTKITSAIAGAIALFIGFAMAGLGLTVLAFLALFAMVSIGLAILAQPFLVRSSQQDDDAQEGTLHEEPQTA